MEKVLVTGAKGFIGKNLVWHLKQNKVKTIYEYDIDTSLSELDEYAKDCEFVFHLAGINRPKDEKEFFEGNSDFTSYLLKKLEENNNTVPFLMSSSIQAKLDNPYGRSKKIAEENVKEYGKRNNVETYVFRLSNVFGKWCRPNYNSVVATFCNNIARDIPIQINDENTVLNLIYVDDVVKNFILASKGNKKEKDGYYSVDESYEVSLGKLVKLIGAFKESREDKFIPDMADDFTRKLYSTYLSYLKKDDFSYELKMNVDERGSFTEFVKSEDRGQVSVNISKPGIVKGNHWHHTKNEKFLVVKGSGVIRFRKIDEEEITEYKVSDKKLEVIDIPVGYTHNIENTGNEDMVTIMWANECFDKDNPDTYYSEV